MSGTSRIHPSIVISHVATQAQLYGQLIMYAQIQTNEATANDLTTTFP